MTHTQGSRPGLSSFAPFGARFRAFGNNLAEIGDLSELLVEFRQKAQPISANRLILVHHQDGIEISLKGIGESRHPIDCFAILASFEKLPEAGTGCVHLLDDIGLRLALQSRSEWSNRKAILERLF
jgi:hypothetical protein